MACHKFLSLANEEFLLTMCYFLESHFADYLLTQFFILKKTIAWQPRRTSYRVRTQNVVMKSYFQKLNHSFSANHLFKITPGENL